MNTDSKQINDKWNKNNWPNGMETTLEKTVKIDDVFYDPPPYLNGALSSMQQKRT